MDPSGRQRRNMTLDEAVTMDILCNRRNSDWLLKGGQRGERNQMHWGPYAEQFEQQHGWRPTRMNFYRFEQRLRENTLFYMNNPRYR